MNDPRYLPVPIDPRLQGGYPIDPRLQGYPPDLRYWVQTIDQQAAGWVPPGYPIPQFPPPEYMMPYTSYLPSPTMDIVPPWSMMPPELVNPLPRQHTNPSSGIPQGVWIGLALVLAILVLPFAMSSFSKGGPSHVTILPQSRALTRINQWQTSQYNDGQYVYAKSACSVAAMTEVINYYSNGKYRSADILAKEIQVGAISPDLGLLNGYVSIRDTVAEFGFKATDLSGKSLDSIISTANSGKPVLVGWPPALWSGGHVLVLRGGNSQNVYLVDSSSYNIKTLSRATFLSRWAGFAVLIEPE